MAQVAGKYNYGNILIKISDWLKANNMIEADWQTVGGDVLGEVLRLWHNRINVQCTPVLIPANEDQFNGSN